MQSSICFLKIRAANVDQLSLFVNKISNAGGQQVDIAAKIGIKEKTSS